MHPSHFSVHIMKRNLISGNVTLVMREDDGGIAIVNGQTAPFMDAEEIFA